MNREEILNLKKGIEVNKLISDLIIKPKFVREKFYAVDGINSSYYNIEFDTKTEANWWVDKIKENCPEHPYLKRNGFIKKEIIYPNYSDDMEMAFQMEEKIEELNLKKNYIKELSIVTGFSDIDSENQTYWKLIHSSALDRCKAALLTVDICE